MSDTAQNGTPKGVVAVELKSGPSASPAASASTATPSDLNTASPAYSAFSPQPAPHTETGNQQWRNLEHGARDANRFSGASPGGLAVEGRTVTPLSMTPGAQPMLPPPQVQAPQGALRPDVEQGRLGAGAPQGEAEAEEIEEEATTLWRVYGGATALAHVASLAYLVITPLVYGVDPSEKETGWDFSARIITLIFSPLTIWQTGYHWYHGLYFPMTASDSWYLARYGKWIDKNPEEIRTWTIFAMMFMGLFFSLCGMFVVFGVWEKYCIFDVEGSECYEEFYKLSKPLQWKLHAHFVVSFMLLMLQLKRFVLSYAFIFIFFTVFSTLGAFTCGYGWCLLVIYCAQGLTEETKFVGFPCWPVFKGISWFYRNL